ncbi:unnamed protein product [Prorocentrum cordatum]|uniref:Cellulase n=1 Tax=Prorocentrum cordatum TaxID=2364126 RepID=A0ABN9X9V9_9DINO|nr:unnamed protein product [Polarella glacialis]
MPGDGGHPSPCQACSRKFLRKATPMALFRVSLLLVSSSSALAQDLPQQELDPALAADDECSAPGGGEPCGVTLLQARASKDVGTQLPSSRAGPGEVTSAAPGEGSSGTVGSTRPGDVQPAAEQSMLARAAQPTAWFVTHQWCQGGSAQQWDGQWDARVVQGARLWANQCQPALWDRGLSVVYTCGGDVRNSGANLSAVVYGNEVCAGEPLRTMSMRPDGCMEFPGIFVGMARFFCMCGFMPHRGMPLIDYQSC